MVFYSQFNEDKILSEIFSSQVSGLCMEVGANDGVHGSTTLFFEKKGWECILVEPNPMLADELRKVRSGRVFECAASSRTGSAILQMAEGEGLAHAVSTIEDSDEANNTLRKHGAVVRPVEVATKRLDDILEEAGAKHIDFMSIDVEGHELEALKGFTLDRWRPTIMILEDNGDLRDHSVRDYLVARGYQRFRRSGVNDWYSKCDDSRFIGRWRRLNYLQFAIKARYNFGWARFKGRLATIPGILSLVHNLRGKKR